ncbi:NADPH-dependent oxidoreductase [Gordoniibacillus kamchatkensis]|uniref:NADPH-dependent oxidoreductase n=1 Tax=Gordoniibacillus kamchatkensis TaxID=1590651 RepID=A0ABR5AKM5_9BACL|nr:oxygen-insensitive NADPH nitroreductase [Paenibacillus sp. VKM B-2647]KIL41582.1 NADPH-dependent oxidoreductase [Paenibacillus sp. VKM B-2647]
MNETLRLLLAHRSIRRFRPDPVPAETVERIIGAAQAASTSSNIQAYSVVGVTDAGAKRRLAELTGGQRHVEQCPLFLVWCADLHRLQLAGRIANPAFALEPNVETFLLATVDAALAAQNAAVAAESLGYGIVYIGGIRNRPAEVTELLGLPQLVYPVFGMCVGVPDQQPDPRPRLPQSAVYHSGRYSDDDALEAAVREYDETMRSYYARRAGGGRDTVWSKEMANRLSGANLRRHLHDYLLAQGFEFR